MSVPKEQSGGYHVKDHHGRHEDQRHYFRACIEPLSAPLIIFHRLVSVVFAVFACHFSSSSLLMICLSRVDLERPVYLLQQDYAGQLVRQCDPAEAEPQRRARFHLFAQTKAAADHKIYS